MTVATAKPSPKWFEINRVNIKVSDVRQVVKPIPILFYLSLKTLLSKKASTINGICRNIPSEVPKARWLALRPRLLSLNRPN